MKDALSGNNKHSKSFHSSGASKSGNGGHGGSGARIAWDLKGEQETDRSRTLVSAGMGVDLNQSVGAVRKREAESRSSTIEKPFESSDYRRNNRGSTDDEEVLNASDSTAALARDPSGIQMSK